MAVAWLQDIYFLFALILAGIVAGYLAGLFGVGGGTIMVPVLATIFPYFSDNINMDMHCAVGTSLALIAPSAYMAASHHLRKGNLAGVKWRQWVVLVCVGVLIGSVITNRVHGNDLKFMFFIYLYLAAWILYRHPKRSNQPQSTAIVLPHKSVQAVAGMVIGAMCTVLGLGGGSFTVPFFSQYRVPMQATVALGNLTGIAVGTFGAIGGLINGWGLAGRPGFSVGYINIPAVLIMAPLTMLCAPLGAKLGRGIGAHKLKRLCIVYYLLIGSYLLSNVLIHHLHFP